MKSEKFLITKVISCSYTEFGILKLHIFHSNWDQKLTSKVSVIAGDVQGRKAPLYLLKLIHFDSVQLQSTPGCFEKR